MPDKYEREIEEILRKASFSGSGRPRRSSGWMSDLASVWQQWTANVSPTRLLVLGMALALLAYFLRAFVPELGYPMTLLALVLLVGGLVLSMSRRNSRQPRSWRGRAVDSPSSEFWRSLKRRWDDWRQRKRWNGPGWH